MLYLPSRELVRPREIVRPCGRVLTALIDTKTGRLVRSDYRNTITRTGLANWLKHLVSAQSYLATCKVGTGLTVPTTSDTALTTLLESKTITSTDDTNATGDNPYIVCRTQFDEDEAIGNVTETGLFLANGGMHNHALIGMGVPTGATQADPVVITDADHGLTDGQRVRFDGVGGMTELNFSGSNYYYVDSLSSSTFALYNDAARTDTVDGSGFTAFTSGGTWKISVPKTSSTIFVVRIEVEIANA